MNWSNEKNIRVAEIGVDLRTQELRKNFDKGKKGSPDTHWDTNSYLEQQQ